MDQKTESETKENKTNNLIEKREKDEADNQPDFEGEAEIAETIRVSRRSILAKNHSGPLPSPDSYREYEEILPGAADRILKMAEEITYSQTKDIADRTRIDDRNSLLGLIFAFLTVLSVLGISFFSLYKGFDLVGFGIILAELSALVIAFIHKSKSKTSDADSTKQLKDLILKRLEDMEQEVESDEDNQIERDT